MRKECLYTRLKFEFSKFQEIYCIFAGFNPQLIDKLLLFTGSLSTEIIRNEKMEYFVCQIQTVFNKSICLYQQNIQALG